MAPESLDTPLLLSISGILSAMLWTPSYQPYLNEQNSKAVGKKISLMWNGSVYSQ